MLERFVSVWGKRTRWPVRLRATGKTDPSGVAQYSYTQRGIDFFFWAKGDDEARNWMEREVMSGMHPARFVDVHADMGRRCEPERLERLDAPQQTDREQ